MARGEILAFVDADHEIAATWVASARAALRQPRTGAVGAPYLAEGRTWVQRTYDGLRVRSAEPRQVAWLGSGNLAVRKAAFASIEGFDERLRTCEDVDFCRRLRASGWEMVADPRLVSVHAGDPATLRDVFFGELWRGRDNLLVSFRPPLDARGVLTALVPAAVLVLLAGAAIACALGAFGLAALALAAVAIPIVLRALQLCTNRRSWLPMAIAQALLVALFFEAGRAFALVARAGHRSRRRGEPGRAAAPSA
jgi:hypothetical protein